jgi:hypothetical protein
VQRAQNIFKNIVRPAIGEKVTYQGRTMTSRNVLPLMRMGLFSVALGESFAAIASVLFDRDRRDAAFKEIGEEWDDDKMRALGLAGERAINDIIMAGSLGLLGQPLDFIKSLKDQSRFKNPAEPPGTVGLKSVVTLAQKAWDQDGSLTRRDIETFAGQMAPGPMGVANIARNVTDEPLYEADNDVRTLRTAAKRWAKDAGLDVSTAAKRGSEERKSANAPVFEALRDALMVGDSDKAKEIANQFKKDAGAKKALSSMKSSVKSGQPFRAGPYYSEEHKADFMKWARKNLPAADVQQIERVQKRYQATARKIGLWN